MTGPEWNPAGSGAPPRRPGPATLIYSARALRDFGDGFVAVLLPVYLIELGLGALQVGVIATAALLGSSLLTLAIGLFARPGMNRVLLLCASALMTGTGLAFAAGDGYAWFLLIAFRRNHQSIRRQREHFRSHGACPPRRLGPRGAAHPDVRGLWPDWRSRGRNRFARSRQPGHPDGPRMDTNGGAEGHVHPLCVARHRWRTGLQADTRRWRYA